MGLLADIYRALFGGAKGRHEWEEPVYRQGVVARTSQQPVVPAVTPPRPAPQHTVLRGHCWVIDGDTIVINKIHIRLSGIDAPELEHPLGQKAKWALHSLCKGQVVTATTDGTVSHDRAVAVCHLPDGRDLAAEMVKAGLALDWAVYSGGKYRHLEPPDARRRLWRANARQRGRVTSQLTDN